jgi:4-alpha-glucanotransferase
MKLKVDQRCAGVCIPLFALRSKSDLGVGDIGGLRQMVELCAEHGITVLQILPINETSFDNSPYNAVCAMALEPTTLQMTPDAVPGLTKADLDQHAKPALLNKLRKGSVKYPEVKKLKRVLLEAAYKRFSKTQSGAFSKLRKEFESFCKQQNVWLEDYALFRVLIDHHGNQAWESWPKEHHISIAAHLWVKTLPTTERKRWLDRMRYYKFVQWVADRQWTGLKREAESKGVYIMGDVPFGVSRCSADVWACPEIFDLDWSMGAPPEPLFQDSKFTVRWGQNWGFPLYKWHVMEKDDFAWWRLRIKHTSRYFHLFRLDHVLGFFRVYAFPWEPKDNDLYVNISSEAIKVKFGALPRFFPGQDHVEDEKLINMWHGQKLLSMVLEAAGDSIVIGEDLGVVPDYVRPALEKLGISGFKIPLFEREKWTSEYLHHYPKLSVATLATHDHETMYGMWEEWWSRYEKARKLKSEMKTDSEIEEMGKMASWELYRTQRYAGLDDRTLIREYNPVVREAICQKLFSMDSWLVILMLPDLLGIKTRFNVPGSIADHNWSARMEACMEDFAKKPEFNLVFKFFERLAEETKRCPRQK